MLREIWCTSRNRWTIQKCYFSRGRKIKCVYMQSNNPGVMGWGFSRLLLHLQLGSLSISVPSSLLEKDKRLILGHRYLFMKASRVVLRLREELLTYYAFRNSLGNEIWSIYNANYSEMWTFYTPCVSVAISGDFCHETARKFTPPWDVYMANCQLEDPR